MTDGIRSETNEDQGNQEEHFSWNQDRLVSGIEALLFASGDPLSLTELGHLCGQEETDILIALAALAKKLEEDSDSGIMLRRMEQRYTLATKPEVKSLLEQLYKPKNRPRLTQAAFEVLAIVAYNQPVTRAQIEQVRGVNSDSIISRLEERGYIYISDTLDAPGRPSLFCTTEKFLLETGIASLDELPPLEMIMYSTLQEFEHKYDLHPERD